MKVRLKLTALCIPHYVIFIKDNDYVCSTTKRNTI